MGHFKAFINLQSRLTSLQRWRKSPLASFYSQLQVDLFKFITIGGLLCLRLFQRRLFNHAVL